MELNNKIILITGGAGSIGSEIVRQLIKYNPKQIRVFDNRETELFHFQNDLHGNENVRFLLGDIRDKERLNLAMQNVNVVFHAAALKHVPSCEFNPFEAVKTNVLGTQNVIECALENNVEKVINISTDKVTNTINAMGATKLLAERLIASAELYKGNKKTIFSSVRFGNVIGSRGSVLELFKKQIENNEPVTVTDNKMTRFIMSISQAVELVLQTADKMKGGEIFILKMPAFKLEDFVNILLEKYKIKKAHIKIIGLRPGEKMYEDLLTEEEAVHAYETDNMFMIITNINDYDKTGLKNTKIVKSKYGSKEVTPLTKDELKHLLEKECLI